MNVRELREMLETLESDGMGELDVKFSYNYGDHWNTIVAADVDGVETAQVKYSDYHQMDKITDDTDDDDDDDDDAGDITAIVLVNHE